MKTSLSAFIYAQGCVYVRMSPPECYNALSCIVRKPKKTTSKFHRIINAAKVYEFF